MKVLDIKDEDVINYKEISMFIALPYCSGKCWRELGLDCSICQNDALRKQPIIDISIDEIINRYDDNLLSSAIVFGGLEPLDSNEELRCFIMNFRYRHSDPIIIYTGYTEDEVINNKSFNWLFLYENIIIKYGRYIPNKEKHKDEILGVDLASPNQYAKIYNSLMD